MWSGANGKFSMSNDRKHIGDEMIYYFIKSYLSYGISHDNNWMVLRNSEQRFIGANEKVLFTGLGRRKM